MTRQQKLKMLEEWKKAITGCDTVMEKLSELIGADGELGRSMYAMQATYTRAISLIVGDTEMWLEWFACENDMGANKLAAGQAKPCRPITDLIELLDLIEGVA